MKTNFKNLIKKLAFPLFILGLAVIVFLMLAENKSIGNLVGKNTDFLAKLEKQNKLLQLQGDIESSYGMMQELLQSGDSKQGKAVRSKIEMARNDLKAIESLNENEDKQNDAYPLIALLSKETNLQYNALEAYANNQVGNAKKMISSASNKELQDSIASVVNVLMLSQPFVDGKVSI